MIDSIKNGAKIINDVSALEFDKNSKVTAYNFLIRYVLNQ